MALVSHAMTQNMSSETSSHILDASTPPGDELIGIVIVASKRTGEPYWGSV
jgi:hypothetical protein